MRCRTALLDFSYWTWFLAFWSNLVPVLKTGTRFYIDVSTLPQSSPIPQTSAPPPSAPCARRPSLARNRGNASPPWPGCGACRWLTLCKELERERRSCYWGMSVKYDFDKSQSKHFKQLLLYLKPRVGVPGPRFHSGFSSVTEKVVLNPESQPPPVDRHVGLHV